MLINRGSCLLMNRDNSQKLVTVPNKSQVIQDAYFEKEER
jgi:hypothetical protein